MFQRGKQASGMQTIENKQNYHTIRLTLIVWFVPKVNFLNIQLCEIQTRKIIYPKLWYDPRRIKHHSQWLFIVNNNINQAMHFPIDGILTGN